LVAPASLSLFAEEPNYTGSVVIDAESTLATEQTAAFAELRARFDGTDRAVALNALQALTELGDGATLIWKRPSRELTGVIKPVPAFRDDEGRVCRHLTYSLSLGTFVREVEGIACREPSGSWALAG
jgi:surface antigen